MEQGSNSAFLEAQLKRIITRLFKECLVNIDEIRQDHLAALKSLEGSIPECVLRQLNTLDLPRYSRVRKRILDVGNDTIRDVSALLNDFANNLKE